MQQNISCPIVIAVESMQTNIDAQLIEFSATAGGLLLRRHGRWYLANERSCNQYGKRQSGKWQNLSSRYK